MPLRDMTELGERLLRGRAPERHQHTLGLLDHRPGLQRSLHLLAESIIHPKTPRRPKERLDRSVITDTRGFETSAEAMRRGSTAGACSGPGGDALTRTCRPVRCGP